MAPLHKTGAVALTAALLVGTLLITACEADEPGLEVEEMARVHAPEIPEYGPERWINAEPLAMEELRGRVVLVDFWEYTCVNCLRTLPYIREWHERYADLGLVIIGVHAPEFEFGYERENLARAVEELGIEYPVFMDNDFALWSRYSNSWWPRKILVDPQGYIVHDHIGEGGYGRMESEIQRLIGELNPEAELPPIMEPVNEKDRPGAVCYPMTPELYAGYMRGRYAHRVYPDQESRYETAAVFDLDKAHLFGDWRVENERLRHFREVEPPGDRITIRFRATEVNAVLEPAKGEAYRVPVELDGKPISREEAGADVRWDEDGASYLLVDSGRMYRVVETPEYGDRLLTFFADGPDFALYAYTFGACAVPE